MSNTKTKKVTLTDRYSGRSLAFRVTHDKWENREYKYGWMTDYQRKRAENFFGEMAAYYTVIEVAN